jgi:hypothetical protein
MWLWIGVGLGALIALSLLVALVFARVVGTLSGDMIELLEDRPASQSPVTDPGARRVHGAFAGPEKRPGGLPVGNGSRFQSK